MKAEKVIELLKLFAENEIDVVIDGGWGVDALLGLQTREHEDLDIAIPHKDVPKLRELLTARGFKEIPRNDSWECNFVLGDEAGNLIDVHSYTFDKLGKNIYGVAYLPEHLTGEGTINVYQVKCIPPEWSVKFHTGYELDENDYLDVKALCEKFDIPLPDEYEKFINVSEIIIPNAFIQ
ncbi:MAG: nucleotidyltransferase family protein [Pyrinomonadaceae bacterium]|nr:nucleotidyltransferase family protein [Pyrinomonadaceae bacterium]